MKILTSEKKLNTLIILTGISGIAALIILVATPLLFIDGKHDFMGNYGGFLSGVLGSVLSFVTVILVYLTYNLQKKQLESQKEELTETRNQLKRQQFENIYFKMLDVIREIGSEIQDTVEGDYFKKLIINVGNEYASITAPKSKLDRDNIRVIEILIKYENGIYDSSDINSLIYQAGVLKLNFPSRVPVWYRQNQIEHAQSILGAIYEKRFHESESQLGSYFRYISNAIDYIEQEIIHTGNEEKQREERIRYIKILAALLTNSQLVVLFYSCLSRISYDTNGELKARNMMEKYEFFKNLLPENLIRPWHQEFYNIPYKFPYDKTKHGPDSIL